MNILSPSVAVQLAEFAYKSTFVPKNSFMQIEMEPLIEKNFGFDSQLLIIQMFLIF